MRQLLIIRPEPGLAASAERAQELGLKVIQCPLFQIEPVAWDIPHPADYDALLLTSANALRHGGAGIDRLRSLPVHAVGAATGAAAKAAGLDTVTVGDGTVTDLLASLPGDIRLLHLAGADHRDAEDARIAGRRVVYRAAEIAEPVLPKLEGMVVALHSPRAAKRFAELAGARDQIAIAAISDVAAEAAGGGWERVEIAGQPNDPSLLALAAMLCHTSPPR